MDPVAYTCGEMNTSMAVLLQCFSLASYVHTVTRSGLGFFCGKADAIQLSLSFSSFLHLLWLICGTKGTWGTER